MRRNQPHSSDGQLAGRPARQTARLCLAAGSVLPPLGAMQRQKADTKAPRRMVVSDIQIDVLYCSRHLNPAACKRAILFMNIYQPLYRPNRWALARRAWRLQLAMRRRIAAMMLASRR